MEFTGERYIPAIDGQIKYEHIHRYALCLELVNNKHVLDIASGEGYGSALLAKVAKSVIGVDISPEAVQHSSQEYGNYQNLQFLLGSCESIPLTENSVDVVTSFETIEHHDKHEQMMLEVKRVIKPEGMLIISSPNRLTYSDEPNYSNPFHVKELYYDDLLGLLSKYFKYVKVYGQRLATGSFVFPLVDGQEKHLKAYRGNFNELNQQVWSLQSPIYFVAICSDQLDAIQTPIDSVYVDESDDIFKNLTLSWHQSQCQLQQTREALEKSEFKLQQTQTELERSQSQLQQTQTELERSQSQLQQTQTEQTPKNSTLMDAIDEKRLLVISRLQSSHSCEKMGNNPWQIISNSAYQSSDSPCITVIISLYNYSNYICECLESVCKSNLYDLPGGIEVLIIDDCSTDKSTTIVEEYMKDVKIPICLIKKYFNTGLADVRNIGLKLARSAYVFILDADNWIYPNCLSVLYREIKLSGCAATYGKIRRFDNQTNKDIDLISCKAWDVESLVKDPYIDAMAMFDKEVLIKLGGYSTEIIEYGWFGWEDYDMWLKLAQNGYSCQFVPQILSSYRSHPSSMINITGRYILNISRYFNYKFPELAKLNIHSDRLFGSWRSEVSSGTHIKIKPTLNVAQSDELQKAYATIQAMSSSKFWKLRNKWFKVKKWLGLTKDIGVKI